MKIISASIEPARPNSAALQHLTAIATGFNAAGHTVKRLWITATSSGVYSRALWHVALCAGLVKCDLLYMRFHPFGIFASLMAKIMRRGLVLEVNGPIDDLVLAHPRLSPFKPFFTWLGATQMRLADHVIVVSPGLQDMALKWNSEVTYIRNGAPAHLADTTIGAMKPRYATFVGELAPWQGIDTLLAATASSSWPEDLKLVIVGGGHERPAVEEAQRKTELIEYAGPLGRDEALEVLRGATLSISPQTGRLARNRLGVSPLKVSESLLLGVPVVVSNLPGQAQLIQSIQGVGAFVPDDSESLALTIRHVADSNLDRRSISRKALETLSWEAVAHRTSRICEDVYLGTRTAKRTSAIPPSA